METPALPVDAEGLARQIGAEVHLRAEAQAQERLARLLSLAPGGACVSLRIGGQWHLFLRPGLDESRRRFAVAHELGHILMHHETRRIAPGADTFAGRDSAGDLMDGTEGTADYAADIFAIRLLSPACVLHELHADTPAAIAALCGLPPRAAALRAERMQLLNRRDAFYGHTLERQVRARFLPVIRARLLPAPPARTAAPALEASAPADENMKPAWGYAAAVLAGMGLAAAIAWVLLR